MFALKATQRFAWNRDGLYTIAVLLMPLLILWHRDNVLYSPPLHTDPWFYAGYVQSLADFKRDLFPNFVELAKGESVLLRIANNNNSGNGAAFFLLEKLSALEVDGIDAPASALVK